MNSFNPFKNATEECISLLRHEIEVWNEQLHPQNDYQCIQCIKFFKDIYSGKNQEIVEILREIILFEPIPENYRWFIDIKLAAVNAFSQRSFFVGPEAQRLGLDSKSNLPIILQILVQVAELNEFAVQIAHMPNLVSVVLEKIESRKEVNDDEVLSAVLRFAEAIPLLHPAEKYERQAWQDNFVKTIRLLGTWKNPKVIPVLKRILLIPAAPALWPEVIKSLGNIGVDEAIKVACSVFANRRTHDFPNGLYSDVDHDQLCYLATDIVFKENSVSAFAIFLQSLEDAAKYYGWENFYDDEFIWLRSDVRRSLQEDRYENVDLFFDVVKNAKISDHLRSILLEWMPDYITSKPEYVNLIEQLDNSQTQSVSSDRASSISSGSSELITFQWKMETDRKDCVYARSGLSSDSHSLHAMTEAQAKEHFWMKYQIEILTELQKYLDQGYRPVTEVGASCIVVKLKSSQTRSYLKGLFQAIFIDEWCFESAIIKLKR